MFGETTIFYIKIWNHPTETTIKKWMFRVPGGDFSWNPLPRRGDFCCPFWGWCADHLLRKWLERRGQTSTCEMPKPMVFRNSEVSQERKAEMMREAARLEMDCAPTDFWQKVTLVTTLVTEKFQLIGFFFGWIRLHPQKSRQGSHCFAGLPGVPSSEHGCSGAQAASFAAIETFVNSLLQSHKFEYPLMLLLFARQGKQNWRLSSNFFSAKCGRVQSLHLKPFHIARWMLTTAWPSCKSMSLGSDWKLLFKQGRWVFPKIMVPPNHPF